MLIYYSLNPELNNILQTDDKYFEGALSIEKERFIIDHGFDGHVYFVEYMKTAEYLSRYEAWKEEHEIKELKDRREKECFKYIDRSKLWYDRLTQEQLDELNSWYEQWLNVTETKIIPVKPGWLT